MYDKRSRLLGSWLTTLLVPLFAAPSTLQAQYSWHTFYPMDRGQQRGIRVGNPWATSTSTFPYVGAQLTWRLPTPNLMQDSSGSNRLNPNFPATVDPWASYYPAHQPEYYMNWWCKTQSPDVFIPSQHNCLDINNYFEIITEIPGTNGSIQYLGLWATGNANAPIVYFDQSACDSLYSDEINLGNANLGHSANLASSNLRPLLYQMPTGVSSIPSTYGPAVCGVTFSSGAFQPDSNGQWGFRQADVVGYEKMYLGTFLVNDLSNGTEHWIEAMNYLYTQQRYYPQEQCLGKLFGGASNPWVNTYPNIAACVVGLEAYWMVDIGNLQWNGIAAWTNALMADGSLDTQPWTPTYTPASAWTYDIGWNGWGNAQDGAASGWGTPGSLVAPFSYSDTCSLSTYSNLNTLGCQ